MLPCRQIWLNLVSGLTVMDKNSWQPWSKFCGHFTTFSLCFVQHFDMRLQKWITSYIKDRLLGQGVRTLFQSIQTDKLINILHDNKDATGLIILVSMLIANKWNNCFSIRTHRYCWNGSACTRKSDLQYLFQCQWQETFFVTVENPDPLVGRKKILMPLWYKNSVRIEVFKFSNLDIN
jgi:hypothetical protein